jgi:hypothetical protein
MKLVTVVLATLSLTVCAHTQIGRTLEQCIQRYGKAKPFSNDADNDLYNFSPVIEFSPSNKVTYFIAAYFTNDKVSRLVYLPDKPNDKDAKIFVEEAEYLLKYGTPEIVWGDSTHNEAKTQMYWTGRDGEKTYTARLTGTAQLEIKDQFTDVGGVQGAKREMMDGHEVTVLPTPEE